MSTAALPEPAAETEILDEDIETPPDLPAPDVGVMLVVEGCKAKGGIKLNGKSGKRYAFRWCDETNALTRKYADLSEFHREERDIRLHRGNQFCVSTRVGVTHPIAAAFDALKTLITSGLRVPAHHREEALQEIGDLALSEVKRIRDARTTALPSVEGGEPAAPQTEAAPATALREEAWKTDSGTLLASLEKTSVNEAAPAPAAIDISGQPVAPSTSTTKPTRAEIQQWPIDNLKAKAKDLAAAASIDAPKGNASRQVLADFVFANWRA